MQEMFSPHLVKLKDADTEVWWVTLNVNERFVSLHHMAQVKIHVLFE